MMRFLLFVFLFLSFAYALGLVLVNNIEIGVNFLFSQAPRMNLGLLLILCLTLGVIIGMLLALIVFRVLQKKWEISRLQKLNNNLQEQLSQAHTVIDRQANAPTIEEAVYGVELSKANRDFNSITVMNEAVGHIDSTESSLLTKKKRE